MATIVLNAFSDKEGVILFNHDNKLQSHSICSLKIDNNAETSLEHDSITTMFNHREGVCFTQWVSACYSFIKVGFGEAGANICFVNRLSHFETPRSNTFLQQS